MQEKAPAARPALDTFGAAVERGERRGNRKIMAKSKLINGDDDDYDARHAMHEIGAAVAAAPRLPWQSNKYGGEATPAERSLGYDI